MHITILLVSFLLARLISAVCEGYSFAFLSLPGGGPGGNYRWMTTDNDCRIAPDTCARANPCDCPQLGCSPEPVHVNQVSIWSQWYQCEPYSKAGSCVTFQPNSMVFEGHESGVNVESCCRNDNKRNLAEGLISEREYQAIEETNAMLDIHKRNYEHALTSGNTTYITTLREIQKRELKDAEARQLEARWLDIDEARS
ncbi:hypothetical protein BDZ45DRAFT_691573 [Acephala macrosclerotiorum]|nr:hypothetical protein BDZ45DRAFT_691573 [Acephala macrosclerotiorum]